MKVPHTASSAALVRRTMTADLAPTLPLDVVDAAALVVSELVGNAVRHGAALPGGGVLARWELGTGGLRLEVVDGGSGPPGAGPRGIPGDEAESGRGLDLVEALATCWGCSPALPGTTVWAELPVARLR